MEQSADRWRTSVLCALPAMATLVLCLVRVTRGQYGSQIGCMDDSCNDKLHSLLERYEYASSAVNGCDTDCLYNCYDVLKEALTAKDGVSCPSFDELASCFGIYQNEWISLAQECPLFTIKEQKDAAEAEAEAEAEAPSPEEGEGGEAEAEAPSPEEGEAGEAEAEAPSPEEGEAGEAEAEAPSPEEGEAGEAEAEAPSSEEGEADGEGEGECSASSGGEGEGEGEASDVGSGCFPDFESYEDFQKYVQGAYYSSVWNEPTNTVGVILSVFFWLGLGSMGVYLGRKQ